MSEDIRGLEELQKALKQFPKNIQKNVITGAVRAGAKPIMDIAKQLVPVKNGYIKKSIKVTKKKSKNPYSIAFAISAGGNIKVNGENYRPFYAAYLEFGTSKMSPKPFMRPAMEQGVDGTMDAVRQYLAKRIDKEIEKAKK